MLLEPRMIQAASLRFLHGLRAGLAPLVDFALPPQCMGCGTGLQGAGGLCGACWSSIAFFEPPFCRISGLPFGPDLPDGELRHDVADNPPPYTMARAVMRYDDHSARMIARFKYADRIEAAPAFARWMLRAGAPLLQGGGLVLPVPLHRQRLFSRRYNQAAELARHVAALSCLPFDAGCLMRVRATRPQVGLSGTARRRNVAGAFRVNRDRVAQIAGKTLVLVDDVVTTGATAEACARALLAAGAGEVRVLALARVVPEGRLTI